MIPIIKFYIQAPSFPFKNKIYYKYPNKQLTSDKGEKAMKVKFYFCNHCKNVAIKVVDHKVPLFCCGEKMTELVPGTTDAAVEKHLPDYTVKNGIVSVNVGSVEHPMTPEHYISLIAVQTDRGVQYKNLTPDQAPRAAFALCEGETVEAVYAYCNLHGLWEA